MTFINRVNTMDKIYYWQITETYLKLKLFKTI